VVHLSETKNQHFISQAELRLNSLNPRASQENQRIYSFEMTDRESFGYKLSSNRGNKIEGSLSIHDLFSFAVVDRKLRLNFEKFFTRYEGRIRSDTESLLLKIAKSDSDIKEEVINLFVAKFLNFVRNPYSVEKILNTFTILQDFNPAQEPWKGNFVKLLSGHRPQQEYLCSQLGITHNQYVTWLGTLFMLLSKFRDGEPNFMEETIRSLFENSDTVVFVMIYRYTNRTCVVSDQGYTIPVSDEKHVAFDFNLSSNAFIRYMFGDLESLTPNGVPQKIIDMYKAQKKKVKVFPFENDMNELEVYNQRTLYQCHSRIYSSAKENHGL
jgi:hypothetical protein